MESDQPEEVLWKVDAPLAEVEFLELEDLPEQERAYLMSCVAAVPGVPAPGAEPRPWQTPRQEQVPSVGFAFGSATAVFDSLQSGAGGPTYESPGNQAPHSLPPYMPGMTMPSPTQHIHINNFTANLNFPPHPSPPIQTSGPTSLPPQPLPFTVGSHYPGPYVAPFPQAGPTPSVYQSGYNTGPPVIMYQPQPLHLAMYPQQSQQQSVPYHAPTPPPHTREGGGIMFGSTPVVSVRHSSSDEEEDQRPATRNQHTIPLRPQNQVIRPQQTAPRPEHMTQCPDGSVVKPQISRSEETVTRPSDTLSRPQNTKPRPPAEFVPRPLDFTSHNQENLTLPQDSTEIQEIMIILESGTQESVENGWNDSSNTTSEPQSNTEDTAAPPASKSWASLFTPSPSGGGNMPPAHKPTARIPPFSPHCGSNNTPSTSTASQEDLELSAYIRSYQLNHVAPSFLPRGLTNRSNWCFVNAILQCLLACPPFYNLMKSLPCILGLRNNKSNTPMIDSIVEFVNEFTPLETMNKNQKKDKARKKEDLPTGNALEPSYVYRTLLQLESETFKVIEGRQEDAEEFLTCVLNMLSDEMSALLKLTEDSTEDGRGEEAASGGGAAGGLEWQEVTSRGRSCITRRVADPSSLDTPVRQLALGLCRYSVKAEGGETSATLQPFFTLQLDIQHDSITSVDEALSENFSSEQLDGYICSKTKQQVEASRNLSLEDLPPILVLHLKRFVYDGTTGGCQKVMKAIEFCVDLEIPREILSVSSKSKYTTKQRQYKLFGVVYHNGREATKGHYVADVYHTGYASWLHCDDSIVKPTAEQLVTQPSPNSVPYILFYRRGDTMVGVEKTVK